MLTADGQARYLYNTGNEKQSRQDTLIQNVLSESQLSGGYHGIRHAAGAREIDSMNEGEGHVPPIVRPDIKILHSRSLSIPTEQWQKPIFSLTPPNTPSKQYRTQSQTFDDFSREETIGSKDCRMRMVYQDASSDKEDGRVYLVKSGLSDIQSPSITSLALEGRLTPTGTGNLNTVEEACQKQEQQSPRRSPSLVFSVQVSGDVDEEEMQRKREYLQKIISEALVKESSPGNVPVELVELLDPPKAKLKRQLSSGSADNQKAYKRMQCAGNLQPAQSSPSRKLYHSDQLHGLPPFSVDAPSDNSRRELSVNVKPSDSDSNMAGNDVYHQRLQSLEIADDMVFLSRTGGHPSGPQLSPHSREVESIMRTDISEMDTGRNLNQGLSGCSRRTCFNERLGDRVGPTFPGLERHDLGPRSHRNPWCAENKQDPVHFPYSTTSNAFMEDPNQMRYRCPAGQRGQQPVAIPDGLARQLISRGFLTPDDVRMINQNALDDEIEQHRPPQEPQYHVIMIPSDKGSPMATYVEPPRSPYKFGRMMDRRDPPASPYKTARASERCEGSIFRYDNIRDSVASSSRSPPGSPRGFRERCRSEGSSLYSRMEATSRVIGRERCGSFGESSGHISSRVKELTEALRQLDHHDKDCTCSKVEDEILRMARDAYKKIRRQGDSPKALQDFEKELQETNSGICEAMRVLCSIKSLCKYGRTLEDVDVNE